MIGHITEDDLLARNLTSISLCADGGFLISQIRSEHTMKIQISINRALLVCFLIGILLVLSGATKILLAQEREGPIRGHKNNPYADEPVEFSDENQGRSLIDNKITTQVIVEDKYFRIIRGQYYEKLFLPPQEEYANKILMYLNEAKTKIEKQGFLFPVKTFPINVYITEIWLSEEEPATANRNYVSWDYVLSRIYYYIKILPGLPDDRLRIHSGHELFHIAQWCYDAYSAIRWNYQFVWLNEAASVWFEAQMTDTEDTYISNRVYKNLNFIYEPLEKENRRHGYGASSFLTYLTSKPEYYDSNLLLQIYERVKAQQDSKSRSGTRALEEALGSDSQLSEEFNNFAFRYITKQIDQKRTWEEPEPSGGKLLINSIDTSQSRSITIADLSAWNCIVEPQMGFTVPDNAFLQVFLEEADLPIKGAIYAKGAVTPWVKVDDLTTGVKASIPRFGKSNRVYVNVVLVNDRALYPYNGNASAKVTIELKELSQELTDFNFCSVAYTVIGDFKDSEGATWSENISDAERLAGSFSGDTFTGAWFEPSNSGSNKGTIIVDRNELRVVSFDLYGNYSNPWAKESAVWGIHGFNLPATADDPVLKMIEFSSYGSDVRTHISSITETYRRIDENDKEYWREMRVGNCNNESSISVSFIDY